MTQLLMDDALTRMPNREQDCGGVLDYAFGTPALLNMLVPKSFQVIPTPPDMSDHHPIALHLALDSVVEPAVAEGSMHFSMSSLHYVLCIMYMSMSSRG